MYAPLKRFGVAGKRIGIVGLGGLGYFGLLFAKAMGPKEIVVFGRTSAKAVDAIEAGADQYVATAESKDWEKPYLGSLDVIYNTADDDGLALLKYLRTLRYKGSFVQIGAGKGAFDEGFNYMKAIAPRGLQFCGSLMGSHEEVEEMLEFVVKHDFKPKLNVVPMEKVNEVLKAMEGGQARYRFVLTHEKSRESNL